jgi:hypothetical protein
MMTDLKLTVTDIEDLTILSTILQDATVLIGDMGYDQDRKQFLMVAARYILSADTKNPSSRRLMGINFDGVIRLFRRGFSPNDHDNVLNLLAIRGNGPNIEIVFSGKAMLRLECEVIKVYAADLGEGWATQFKPRHDA